MAMPAVSGSLTPIILVIHRVKPFSALSPLACQSRAVGGKGAVPGLPDHAGQGCQPSNDPSVALTGCRQHHGVKEAGRRPSRRRGRGRCSGACSARECTSRSCEAEERGARLRCPPPSPSSRGTSSPSSRLAAEEGDLRPAGYQCGYMRRNVRTRLLPGGTSRRDMCRGPCLFCASLSPRAIGCLPPRTALSANPDAFWESGIFWTFDWALVSAK